MPQENDNKQPKWKPLPKGLSPLEKRVTFAMAKIKARVPGGKTSILVDPKVISEEYPPTDLPRVATAEVKDVQMARIYKDGEAWMLATGPMCAILWNRLIGYTLAGESLHAFRASMEATPGTYELITDTPTRHVATFVLE